jgi:hypothetical protein
MCLLDEADPVGIVGYVARNRDRTPQAVREPLDAIRSACGQDESGSRTVQALREPSAKSGTRSGDDDDTIFEPVADLRNVHRTPAILLQV